MDLPYQPPPQQLASPGGWVELLRRDPGLWVIPAIFVASAVLDRLEVERVGDEVHIRAAARSFLHHQVRSMVGCLALVGMGRWREAQVGEALAARDRQALGLNAPSEGLYFVRALYPDD